MAPLGLLCLSGMLGACGSSKPKEVRFLGEEPFPKKLSEWNLFLNTRGGPKPNARVVPYDLNTPLFSDYANKYRFVWMPPGASAQYRTEGTFEFPVGTIFAKSFAFPVDGPAREERLIETRLLVHARSGWVPLPYVWNAQQTEATLRIAADPVNVRFIDATGRERSFAYHIPNTNECRQCHENAKVMLPIGPKARNLPRGGMNARMERWTSVRAHTLTIIVRIVINPVAAPDTPAWIFGLTTSNCHTPASARDRTPPGTREICITTSCRGVRKNRSYFAA